MDNNNVSSALKKIAKNDQWRAAFIRHLIDFEKKIATPGTDIREEVTGHLVDALFEDDQIVRRELEDNTILEFYYRSKISRDFVMSSQEKPNHAWEPQTTRLLIKLAENAKNVIIGGAYFGDHAILIAKQAKKSGGIVHAFEPNNDQRKMLMHNAQLNSLDNIREHKQGLWDNSTSHIALVGYDSLAHPELVTIEHEDSFSTITIDDYLHNQNIDKLDLIMLDIEGAELKALKGAESFLKQAIGQAPNIVFEVHRDYVDWSIGLENTDIVKFLRQYNYHIYAIRDFHSNYDMSKHVIELIPVESVYLEGPAHGFNMLAIKDTKILSHPDFLICEGVVSPKLLRHKDASLHHPINGL